MKRSIIIFAIIFITIVALFYWPQKIAVKKDDLINVQDEYIICEPCLSTGFEWVIIETSPGYERYQNNNVFIEGEMENPHQIFSMNLNVGDNRYILYGKFLEEKFFDVAMHPVFMCDNWDIIYPVKRDSSTPKFLNPSYGLTWFDFYH